MESPDRDPTADIPYTDNPDTDNPDAGLTDAGLAALAEARQRLAEVPAAVVVANHAMGLFELAAIHLSTEPPNLSDSALAIDALACLVEGVADRLGEHSEVLVHALGNIRLAFVEVSSR